MATFLITSRNKDLLNHITTSISTTELMSTPLQAMSVESRPAGPSDDAIKQRIRRLKRKIFSTIIPKTREEIIFPDQYTLDLRSKL